MKLFNLCAVNCILTNGPGNFLDVVYLELSLAEL